MNGHRSPAGLATPSSLSTKVRPKGYAALAVALLVGFGALGFWFYTSAGQKVPVVVAVRDIPVGHTIARADLSTIEVSGGVTAVAGDHLSSLLGQTAAVEIQPNTLVQRSMVTAGTQLPAGDGLVGVAAAPGQIPSSGLAPGDKVEVFQLTQKGVTSTATPAGDPSTQAGAGEVGDGVRRAGQRLQRRRDAVDAGRAARLGLRRSAGQQRRSDRAREGRRVAVIVAVGSDKGSPGATTLATALGLVWPGDRLLCELDPRGADLPFRLMGANGQHMGGGPVAGHAGDRRPTWRGDAAAGAVRAADACWVCR